MLNFLQKVQSYIPPVVWETAITLVLWLRKIIRGGTPKVEDKPPPQGTPRIFKLDIAKRILKVIFSKKEDALKSRSVPNERLATTFKIENAFTTMSLAVHHEYVHKVKDLLRIASYPREHVLIKDIFETEKQIFVEKYGDNLPFKKYILTASFKFAIKRFLGEHVNRNISEDDMSALSLEAGDKITSLWMESKKGAVDEEQQRNLFDVLKKLFPELDVENPSENPLGIILPSFETFWRVLYRLCVTIVCNAKSDLYLDTLRAFGEDPSEETFKKVEKGISVEYIAKEILFLNPPTRTIYRTDENNNTVGIDVKLLHLEEVHTKEFDPTRWGNTGSNDIPYFTFGYSAFSCPAKRFAPIAIGLIGATIFDIFKEYQWDINFEEFNSTEEKNDRDKYFEFEIKKMK